MKKLLSFYCALLVTAGAFTVSAQPLVYESFDYSPGALTGNGGTGFSSAWSLWYGNDLSVTAPSLSYTGVPSTGNKATFVASDPGGDFDYFGSRRSFSSTFNSGELWLSFLYESAVPDLASSYQFLRLNSSLGNHLDIGHEAGSTAVTLNGVNTGTTLDGGTTGFLVVQILFDNSGSDETINFWLNPLLSGVGTADFTTTLDVGTLDELMLNAGTNQNVSWDEIRMGTTYLSVIPEPSTFALLAAGLVTMLSLRRLRRE